MRVQVACHVIRCRRRSGSRLQRGHRPCTCPPARPARAQDPEKPIQMYINSPGGVVTAGLAIYDTMQVAQGGVDGQGWLLACMPTASHGKYTHMHAARRCPGGGRGSGAVRHCG